MKRSKKWMVALLGALALAQTALALEDGIYRDKAPGYGGDVIVEAVVREGKMTEIRTENTGGDKSDYYLKAEKELIAQILEKQSLEGVDAVAGSTGTSESILQAMQGIWEQAEYTGRAEGGNSVKAPTLTPEPKPTV